MSTRFLLCTLAGFLTFTFGRVALADTIAAWDLTGAAGNQVTQAPSAAALHVTGLSMARGAGVAASAAANSFSSNSWNSLPAATPDLDTEYVSFGFAVDPASLVDLASLTIGTQSSATGPGTMGLYYSGNNFATPIQTFVQPSAALLNSVVNLSTLTNLSGNVEFRLIEIGNTAPNLSATAAGGTFRVAENSTLAVDVNFAGTVKAAPPTVPTPSAVGGGLALFGCIALARWRFSNPGEVM